MQNTRGYNGFYDNAATYAPGLSASPHDMSGKRSRFARRGRRSYNHRQMTLSACNNLL